MTKRLLISFFGWFNSCFSRLICRKRDSIYLTKMPQLNRSRLLQFLFEPRYARDVAGHFNIPAKMADYRLKQAVRSGLVFKGKLKRSDGFLYVSRNSPLLAKYLMQHPLKRNGKFFLIGTSKYVPLEFASKVGSHKEGSTKEDMIAFTGEEEGTVQIKGEQATRPRINSVSTFLNVLATKGRLVRINAYNHLVKREESSSQGYRPLSQVERIRLFQAVSVQPLTYLELHERFGVSKQVVERLVRRGLLEKVWGARNIGVKFRLTNKGNAYTKELKVAARCEPKIRKKAIVHLKTKTPL